MAEDIITQSAAETDGNVKTWKRRGLLAAAWAAVAALVAKQTTAPVEAGSDGDVVAGGITTTTQATVLRNNLVPADVTQAPQALVCQRGSEGSLSIKAYFLDAALVADNAADNSRAPGYGIWCLSNGPAALLATGANIGVDARGSAVAVRGQITNGFGNSIAVQGFNSGDGFGVYGVSRKFGVAGATAPGGTAGIVGATNGVADAYAGLFYGPVIVSGAFTVLGAKSAAVPHPDGSHRLLYCIESPESWFEDFGKGALECGQADVAIDPDFAAVADVDDYQVFLTGYDHDHVLHVTNRTPNGFTVRADVALARLKGQREDELSGAFGWRVVAKRKDIVGERLARVTIPPEPVLPTEPPMHEAPTPDIRSRTVRQ